MNADTTEDALTNSKTISSTSATNVVDAWGTARLGGEDVEALRICSFDTTISETFDDGVSQGIDTVITIDYTFVSKNNGFLAQITSLPGESDPGFNMASFVLRVTGGITTSVDEEPGNGVLPTTFDLSQNYPNPFNPETKIRYSVGEAGHVELTVFDLNGRKVKTLLSKPLQPGNYAVSCDGTDNLGAKVASGRYIYNIRLHGEAKSKMMILVK
jgi:hypothetical protein